MRFVGTVFAVSERPPLLAAERPAQVTPSYSFVCDPAPPTHEPCKLGIAADEPRGDMQYQRGFVTVREPDAEVGVDVVLADQAQPDLAYAVSERPPRGNQRGRN
jgi:hypothetical protein